MKVVAVRTLKLTGMFGFEQARVSLFDLPVDALELHVVACISAIRDLVVL